MGITVRQAVTGLVDETPGSAGTRGGCLMVADHRHRHPGPGRESQGIGHAQIRCSTADANPTPA